MAERGFLKGLPVPIKDLADVAGVRSTQGSPIYANRIAETSDIVVTHLENEGGGLRWEVKTDDGSHQWEIQVDAGSGSVVSNQPEE